MVHFAKNEFRFAKIEFEIVKTERRKGDLML
jgi:hypothetical protein